jgi:hydrogenase expression/formation protein HypE
MSESTVTMQGPVCPVPLHHHDQIVMGHGSGGRMTEELIREVFAPYFDNPALQEGNDFAQLSTPQNGSRLSVSTDSHIVFPLTFPGGDIGRLAVCGTVNDVAMAGADPVALTAGFILEEGLSIAVLSEVVKSMAASAAEAGVKIVAGDTKVVERGKADGLFINTSGFGWIPNHLQIGGQYAKPGDAVLISGSMGDHGIAVLAARGDLGFETQIQSDVAPLNHLIHNLTSAIPQVHVLRDPTRGGLATTLNEIARQSNVTITIDEGTVPIKPAVASACEMLGFDPLYVANEGKVIIILPEEYVDQALTILHDQKYGKEAVRIGSVTESARPRVLLKTRLGSNRLLDVLAGEMLPRIC